MEAKALLDSLDVGLVAIAPDWTIVEWTAPAALITGLPAERVLGQNFWMVFPTAKGTPIERTLLDVAVDGRARTYVSPAPGSEFPGMVFETRVTRGPRNHLILLFRQVREELAPEARTAQILTAFETERRLYLRLFHALPIPALVLALDGQIIEANAAGSDLLGAANSHGLVGRSLADWLGAERRGALANALRDATLRPQRIQVALELGGEPVREVEAVITNVDAADQAAKVLFLAVEVSREVLLQRKLLHADRLSQLGALVSGVAHELNNPLAAIAAFAELLAVDANTAELKESAEIIHTEAIRAGRVVQTLLDFARQRPHRREAVDLKDIVERVLALHRSALKKSRVYTTVQIDDRVPAVLGDTQELQQVVLNAVANAEQAIAAGGKPGKIAISARRVDDHVVLVVEDSGPGVPPEIMDRVFCRSSPRRARAAPGSACRSASAWCGEWAGESTSTTWRRGARGSASSCRPNRRRPNGSGAPSSAPRRGRYRCWWSRTSKACGAGWSRWPSGWATG